MDEAGGLTDDWTPLALTWTLLVPPWTPLTPPVVVVLDAVALHGFACMSSPLPVGDWQVRLRLGPTRGQMRLVICDRGGQRREPRTDLFPNGDAVAVIASIAVPADFTDMGLVIQKRDDGPGEVAILGVDARPVVGG